MLVTRAWYCTQMICSDWCVTTECETQCSVWCNELTVYAVRLMALPVAHEYACLMVRGYKTAETKTTAHLKKMGGQYVVMYDSQLPAAGTLSEVMLLHRGHLSKLVDELRQHWPDVSDVMLNSQWPEGGERSDGCAWALVLVGETVTKTCCRGACTHDCDPQASDCDVSSQTWCTRKNLCVPQNWQFRHATRILDVIMLDYPVKVRPIPGMWVQSVPVTAIPWDRMKTEQRNLVIRSIRKHD